MSAQLASIEEQFRKYNDFFSSINNPGFEVSDMKLRQILGNYNSYISYFNFANNYYYLIDILRNDNFDIIKIFFSNIFTIDKYYRNIYDSKTLDEKKTTDFIEIMNLYNFHLFRALLSLYEYYIFYKLSLTDEFDRIYGHLRDNNDYILKFFEEFIQERENKTLIRKIEPLKKEVSNISSHSNAKELSVIVHKICTARFNEYYFSYLNEFLIKFYEIKLNYDTYSNLKRKIRELSSTKLLYKIGKLLKENIKLYQEIISRNYIKKLFDV